MAKLSSTESAQRTIDSAVQLLGARWRASRNIVEQLYREIRSLLISKGDEVQRLVIDVSFWARNVRRRRILGQRRLGTERRARPDLLCRDALPPRAQWPHSFQPIRSCATPI